MRRVVITLAAIAVVGLATSSAWAGNGYGGRGGQRSYGYGYYPPAQRYYSDSHSAAVQRIMAAHSRYRYNPHPRSFYKSPPHPYDYRGWGYRR